MSDLTVFAFDTAAVRTLTIEGEPWFVAGDIANVLGYRNAPDMVRMLDEDEAATHNVRSRSADGVLQDREVTIINESGLYACVLKSRRKEAKVFRKWITSEVLPALRRTGSYSMPGSQPAAHATILSSNPNHVADQLTSADRIFRSILRASRAAGVPLPRALRRANEVVMDRIGLDMLNEIQAEDVVTETHIAAIDPIQVHEFCDAWLGGDLPLPVVPCRSEDLYAAWVHWRRQQGHGTAPLPRVVSAWTRRTDVDHRRMRYEGQDGRVLMSGIIVPESERHPPPPATQRDWITQRVREFAAALEAWRTAPE